MKYKNKLFLSLVFILFLGNLLPACSAQPISFYITTKYFVHFDEPTTLTTGKHLLTLVNNNETTLGFTFDEYNIDYMKLRFRVDDIAGASDDLWLWFGIVIDFNSTHTKILPFIFEYFITERNEVYEATDLKYSFDYIFVEDFKWIEITGVELRDFVIYTEITGSVTFYDHLIMYLSYYTYKLGAPPNFIDDIAKLDDWQDFLMIPFVAPLVLIESGDWEVAVIGWLWLIAYILIFIGLAYKIAEYFIGF